MQWKPSRSVIVAVIVSLLLGMALAGALQGQEVMGWSRMDAAGDLMGVMCFEETGRCVIGLDPLSNPGMPTIFAAGFATAAPAPGVFCFTSDMSYGVPPLAPEEQVTLEEELLGQSWCFKHDGDDLIAMTNGDRFTHNPELERRAQEEIRQRRAGPTPQRRIS